MDESSAAKEPHAENDAAPPTPSLIADRYRVLRVLGEGSTGTVYLCEHTALEKEVAVKVLHRELAENAGLVARFTREAQTAARLDHPSSVHVMDFGQARDGTLYLVMEYVEGLDLAQLLDEQAQLDDERIVHIMSCILSALSAAHALGIVHRDLKPENVLIRSADPSAPGPDVVKVCDFGVAQFSPVRVAHNNNHSRKGETGRVTGDGMLVGTPWYMSPEQARAEKLDARSDIYSAGVVLFQLLTRTLPFMGDDVMAVALMHCTTPPPPPSGFGVVHPGLEAVCLRALSKTREARYQTANEMLDALRAALTTKVASRSLARISKPPSAPGSRLTVSPLAASYPTLSGSATTTPMSTPTVKHPPTLRRRKGMPSVLAAGVATAVLGVVALPRLLPGLSTQLQSLLRASPSAQPAAASHVRIQNDPELRAVAAAPGLAESARTQSTRELLSDGLPGSEAPAMSTPEATEPLKLAQPIAATSRPRRARVSQAAQPASARSEASRPSATVAPALGVDGADAPARAAGEPAAIAASEEPAPRPETAGSARAVAPVASVASGAAAAASLAGRPVAPASAPGAKPSAAASETASSPTTAVNTPVVPENPQPAAADGVAPAPAAAEAGSTKPQPSAAAASKPQPKAAVAHVQISTDHLPPGTSRASLYSSLSQASLVSCYVQAQQRFPLSDLPAAVLELRTNTSGRIVWAHVTNGPAPLRECLEQVARSGHVRTGEGGELKATLNLTPAP